jgi:predicted N-acetyltransferase YhbS
LWEAADVQWWSRMPRRSDEVEQAFWLDSDGPVAAVLLTSLGEEWQCDPLIASADLVSIEIAWAEVEGRLVALAGEEVSVPVRDDDVEMAARAAGAGLIARRRDATAWMAIEERPSIRPLPDGFRIVDRASADGNPHPFRSRNGDAVESRLRECSLYDPRLDLAVETADGEVAAYSLYWLDPTTGVGLLEPMRVEEEFQRRGLAYTMFAEGAARLAGLGARRIKVSCSTEPAAALYAKCGFRAESTATWYGTR